MNILEAQQISKHFGTVLALEGVSLRIKSGEILAVVGESGSGKSTLLQLLAGLQTPDSGDVLFQHLNLKVYSEHLIKGHPDIQLVAQDYRLFPNISIAANIMYALRKYNAAYQHERTQYLLETCGLREVAQQLPRQTSGGEQQRTAIAKAIADEPKVLLLDEPFSHLDSINKLKFRQMLLTLVADEQIATVLVTHDMLDALAIAQRIALMYGGEILQEGTFEELRNEPKSQYVSHFIEAAIGPVFALAEVLKPSRAV